MNEPFRTSKFPLRERKKKKRKDPTKEGKDFELGINFALAKIKK